MAALEMAPACVGIHSYIAFVIHSETKQPCMHTNAMTEEKSHFKPEKRHILIIKKILKSMHACILEHFSEVFPQDFSFKLELSKYRIC